MSVIKKISNTKIIIGIAVGFVLIIISSLGWKVYNDLFVTEKEEPKFKVAELLINSFMKSIDEKKFGRAYLMSDKGIRKETSYDVFVSYINNAYFQIGKTKYRKGFTNRYPTDKKMLMSSEFLIFGTNKSNFIEKIAVCDIDNHLGICHYTVEEVDQDYIKEFTKTNRVNHEYENPKMKDIFNQCDIVIKGERNVDKFLVLKLVEEKEDRNVTNTLQKIVMQVRENKVEGFQASDLEGVKKFYYTGRFKLQDNAVKEFDSIHIYKYFLKEEKDKILSALLYTKNNAVVKSSFRFMKIDKSNPYFFIQQ